MIRGFPGVKIGSVVRFFVCAILSGHAERAPDEKAVQTVATAKEFAIATQEASRGSNMDQMAIALV